MSKKEITNDLIRAYALKNAVEHNGKAVVGSVLSPLFAEGLKKEDAKDFVPKITIIVNEVNKMGIELQKMQLSKVQDMIGHRPEREGIPELPNVDKKKGVVMRLSPSPSGPMHIGHALTGMLNLVYVRKYGGKFYLRIEDTNPENIYNPAYKMIPEEAEWLFGKIDEVIIQSDRLKIYYDYAEKLVNSGDAYVCDCDPEKFKELIIKKKECGCRKLDSKEHIKRWKKMLSKTGYKPGQVVLRFKSDIKASNPALRDFPIARINTSRHPKQGKKYRVWPLMNLSVAIDDIEYSMTHIIRAKEHRDNAKRQKLIYKALGKGKKYPEVFFLGRYKFRDLEISCSKTKARIEKGEFSGWSDIRIPFIDSIRKRGFMPKAFEMMAEQRGISDVDKVISKSDFFEVLENFNREVLKEMIVRKAKFAKAKKGNIEILMPNNQVVYGSADIKPKKDEIVHLIGLGYCKWNQKEKQFWFAHK